MNDEQNEIRPSQLIYQAGPGAIVDLVDESVMILSADQWNTVDAVREDDKRIARNLNVEHVRILNENTKKQAVAATPFPRWKICPKCGTMTTFKNQHCYSCEKSKNEQVALYPSRFVVACRHGHISDFPYERWVHRNQVCKKPSLKLFRGHTSGSLSDLIVKCVACGEGRSLGKIMKPDEEDTAIFVCKGEAPWLDDPGNVTEKGCNQKMQTFLRGASNIYSPYVLSFLQVPMTGQQGSNPLLALQEELEDCCEEYEDAGNKEKALTRICKRYEIPQEMANEVECILRGDPLPDGEQQESIRKQEWNTLIEPYFNEEGIRFNSEKVDIHEALTPYFSAIHRVDSVPEVQVLKGFSRIEYVDRFEEGDVHVSPVLRNPKANWLPAVRNYGEGIFFVFHLQKLLQWEQEETMTAAIIKRYNEQRAEFGNEPLALRGRHLLLHTFSHALLRELAAHSGYGTTSLKERLYVDATMHGVFIYTASGDSEGSLGGLTGLTDPDTLYPIIVRAIERMQYCSSDPNCSDGQFYVNVSANAAACHSCAHVSETSCEWGNQLLDRRLLLNLNETETCGYFDGLLTNA